MLKDIENLKLICIKKTDPKELDMALAEINSNNIIPGTVSFWNAVNQEGKIEFCYRALSKI